jgi:hypothetical protein
MIKRPLMLVLLLAFSFTAAFSAAVSVGLTQAAEIDCHSCSQCWSTTEGKWIDDGRWDKFHGCYEHVCIIPECDEIP